MPETLLAGHHRKLRLRPPIFWQRWNVSPYQTTELPDGKKAKRKLSLPIRLDRSIGRRGKILPESVFIGADIEPYPELEKTSRITRRCLEVLGKHGCPLILSTASTLVLRDIDLIRELHEDSLATIGFQLYPGFNDLTGGKEPDNSLSELVPVLERICRSGVQTGFLVGVETVKNLTGASLNDLFVTATKIGLDFIHFTGLNILKANSTVDLPVKKEVREAVLRLSKEYSIPLTPRRHLPKDIRLENFWLAEMLSNQAYYLELSGVRATKYWDAVKKIDNFDGDIRVWALRGELAAMVSADATVRGEIERLMRGERFANLPGKAK